MIIHTSLVKNDVIENVWPSKCVLFVYAYMHYFERLKHRTAVSEVTCLNLRQGFYFFVCLILNLKPLFLKAVLQF